MTPLVPGRNLVLAGMMGTGKSAVGKLVAGRLARPFVDTDAMVERDAGSSVAEIFREQGERAFRDLESSAIRAVSSLHGQVVAVGGGALLRADNVTSLRGTGDVVVLDAEPEVLARRVGEAPATRPLLSDREGLGTENLVERLRSLRSARREAYLKAAATLIDTSDLDVEGVAAVVLAWARSYPGLLAHEETEALP